jgi:hypothetical protein
MLPKFLRSEILPYASVEIIRADQSVEGLRARLTDSAPVTICAWCPTFVPGDPANAGASHGLCDVCAARLLTTVTR